MESPDPKVHDMVTACAGSAPDPFTESERRLKVAVEAYLTFLHSHEPLGDGRFQRLREQVVTTACTLRLEMTKRPGGER